MELKPHCIQNLTSQRLGLKACFASQVASYEINHMKKKKKLKHNSSHFFSLHLGQMSIG